MFKKIMSLILLVTTCNIANANNVKHDLLMLKKAYSKYKGIDLDVLTLSNSENCLAKTIYYEVRGSSLEEQFLVGIVTINRAESDNNQFANTICKVISQKNQFSWYLKFKRYKIHDHVAWKNSVIVAKVLISHKKQIMSNIKYFHSKKMHNKPKWSRKMQLSYTGIGHLYY